MCPGRFDRLGPGGATTGIRDLLSCTLNTPHEFDQVLFAGTKLLRGLRDQLQHRSKAGAVCAARHK